MFEALITFVMRVEVMDTSRNYYGGTPCAMKVACTVWTGEKMEIVSKSYLSVLTKSNQKPLYKTRFMLDELGNLQSEGHGISGFETMLSIGLGQEQQFTLILQTEICVYCTINA